MSLPSRCGMRATQRQPSVYDIRVLGNTRRHRLPVRGQGVRTRFLPCGRGWWPWHDACLSGRSCFFLGVRTFPDLFGLSRAPLFLAGFRRGLFHSPDSLPRRLSQRVLSFARPASWADARVIFPLNVPENPSVSRLEPPLGVGSFFSGSRRFRWCWGSVVASLKRSGL